jgi:hypothetical protein
MIHRRIGMSRGLTGTHLRIGMVTRFLPSPFTGATAAMDIGTTVTATTGTGTTIGTTEIITGTRTTGTMQMGILLSTTASPSPAARLECWPPKVILSAV